MEDFDQFWAEMQRALDHDNKIVAVKLIRYSSLGMSMSLMQIKHYVDRHWSVTGLEDMRKDLMNQLGINPAHEKLAANQPFKVVQDENFTLTIKKDVSWDQMNEFFAKVARDLGF